MCLELSGTNKFLLVCLFFQISLFEALLLNLRPVLHYEVFNVPLRFSATACLVYTSFSSLSIPFLKFFEKVFCEAVFRSSFRTLPLFRALYVRIRVWRFKNRYAFQLPVSDRSFIIALSFLLSTPFLNFFQVFYAAFCCMSL